MAKGHITINQDLCKGCQLCVSFCPKTCIGVSKDLNPAGYQPAAFKGDGDCTGCATCAVVCPEVAIEVYRD